MGKFRWQHELNLVSVEGLVFLLLRVQEEDLLLSAGVVLQCHLMEKHQCNYVFLFELKTKSRQSSKFTTTARPTRWISRFSQQIKVSTAPISKALQCLSDDYVCGSRLCLWEQILIRNTLRVSSTPKQYLPVSWEISSKYLKSIFYCTFINENFQ